MTGLSDAHLTATERDRLRRILGDFALACQRAESTGEAPRLTDYLPPAGDRLRLRTLQQLIVTDLNRRCGRGESVLLEEYLESFPELGTADDVPTLLVYEEFCIRNRCGDRPSVATYEQRFPLQYQELVRLVKQQGPRAGTLVPSHTTDWTGVSSIPPNEQAGIAAPRDATRTDTSSDAKAQVRTVGGGYRLIRLLGQGQFGEAWLAEAPGGVEVAVKLLRFPVGHKMSQQEEGALELMKRLRHSYLLQVQAYWVYEDHLVIVMDLADTTLEDRFEECRRAGESGIPCDEMVRYMCESAEAMDYLHREHVLHRDIKPANILLLKDHAKLGDFGLARVLRRDELSITATSMGTPLYMAPEVWEGKVGPRSDQYSLAVTYVELRTGRPPFSGGSMAEVMRDHLEHRPELSLLEYEEQQVVSKALAKKPEDRYPSCVAFADALKEATQPQPTLPATWPFKLLLGMVTVAVLAWCYWVFLRFSIQTPAAITVAAGDQQAFHINIRGAKPKNVDLDFQVIPPGRKARFEWNPTGSGVEVTATAPLDSRPGDAEIIVSAKADWRSTRKTILLQVLQADYVMPDGCQPADGAILVSADEKIFYDRIQRVLPSDTRIEFVLVKRTHPNDPATFYMMKNKVWNALFAEFAEACPEKLAPETEWSKGARVKGDDLEVADYPQHPVLRVGVEEAHHFAQWLGGLLPTVRQWDKAAGRLDHVSEAEGPFQQPWEPADPTSIAVARADEGPLPVGTAAADVSSFGCRDMAGNGREWTRNIALSDRTVPLEFPGELDGVTLRGRSYTADQPLRYEDLDDESRTETAIYPSRSPLTSFRVVIEGAPAQTVAPPADRNLSDRKTPRVPRERVPQVSVLTRR